LNALKIIVLLICSECLFNCNGNHRALNTGAINDSTKQKTIDSQMALGDRPDSEQEGPTFAETKAEYLATYNKIDRIDTLIIDGKDSLHIQTKYYCLHDSTLIVPKRYNWGEKNPKDFVTHNFATKILITNNKDTIFNKTIRKGDFNKVIDDELKKYAIIFSPGFSYSQKRQEIVIGYFISIPLTDLGSPAFLVVNKKGEFKFLMNPIK
jgi:hypothetical protein